MKRGLLAAVLFLAISLVPYAGATCLNPGTVDGYIYDMTPAIVSGATVTVTVSGCSGSCCSASATSQSNGYYVVTGLQASASDTVTVSATKSSASGSNTGIMNSFVVSQVNVTLCTPPSAPTLTAPTNGYSTHNGTNINFTWTSGTDPNSFPKFDQYSLDSVLTYVNSSIVKNLSLGGHTWFAKTCNSLCCGSASARTVTISNSAPSSPTLVVQQNTTSTSATFQWSSGTDPDGDATHDEYHLSSASDYSSTITSDTSAVSPKIVGSLPTGTLYWRVRTCDSSSACSAYSTGSFNVIDCGGCPSSGTSGIGGGGAPSYVIPCVTPITPGVAPEAPAATPQGAPVTEETPIRVDLQKAEEKVTLKKGTTINLKIGLKEHNIAISKITGDTVEFVIRSSPKYISIISGHQMDVDVDDDGKFDVTITVERVYENSVDLIITPWEQKLVVEKPAEIRFVQTTQEIIKRVPSLPWIIVGMLMLIGFSVGVIFEDLVHNRIKRVDQALVRYVGNAVKKGHTEQEIRRKLSEAGWTEEEIRYGLNKVKNK